MTGLVAVGSSGAASGKPAVALLLLAGAIGACLLWALVVGLHSRRQSRMDLIALEARIQAKHARPSRFKVTGHTVPETDAAQAAWAEAHTPHPSGVDLPKP